MADRPLARSQNLISEWVDDELVIYDETADTAHCLAADAAAVWQRCDGQLSSEALATELGLEHHVVARSLLELEDAGLMDQTVKGSRDYSRREAALRLAKIGGAAVAAPLVYTVAVPAAAAAVTAVTCHSTNPGGVPTGPQPAAGVKGYSTLAACGGGVAAQFNFTCYVQTDGSVICANSSCNVAGMGCGTCCATSGAGCTAGGAQPCCVRVPPVTGTPTCMQ